MPPPVRDLTAAGLAGYDLLDSGGGRKLERIAGVLVDRPSPPALWSPRLDAVAWQQATSRCERTDDGGGFWRHRAAEPSGLELTWSCAGRDLRFALRFTSFGHCGVFVEQAPVWRWLERLLAAQAAALGRAPKFLNLFGYTGAASLVAAAAGAEVFHVDSAKGVLTWGRESAQASGLDERAVRWVHDDARAFLAHSRKKGFRYDAILADPPSWGHGVDRKTVWTIEDGMQPLAGDLAAVLADGGAVALTSHTPGVQHHALRNVLAAAGFAGLVSGDLAVAHHGDERLLPAGVYAMAGAGAVAE